MEKNIKVYLICVDYYRDNKFEYYMEELENLAKACGFEVVGKTTQKLEKIDNKSYFGKEKFYN